MPKLYLEPDRRRDLLARVRRRHTVCLLDHLLQKEEFRRAYKPSMSRLSAGSSSSTPSSAAATSGSTNGIMRTPGPPSSDFPPAGINSNPAPWSACIIASTDAGRTRPLASKRLTVASATPAAPASCCTFHLRRARAARHISGVSIIDPFGTQRTSDASCHEMRMAILQTDPRSTTSNESAARGNRAFRKGVSGNNANHRLVLDEENFSALRDHPTQVNDLLLWPPIP